MRFFICGGGCYGTFYLRQLDRARARGGLDVTEIIVVDRDPECQASEKIADVAGARLIVADWIEFGEQIWRNEADWSDDAWVPAPIAPHIAFEWIRSDLAARGRSGRRARVDVAIDIPFCATLDNGSLAVSHAPGVCPTNCIEPAKCPLTGTDRDWEMRETIAEHSGLSPTDVGIFQCRHLSFGVGVIPLAEIYAGASQLRSRALAGVRRLGVATVSSCHGLLDVLELDERAAAAD